MINSVDPTQTVGDVQQTTSASNVKRQYVTMRGSDYERTPDSDSFESDKNKTGKTVGIVAGALAAVALVVGGICLHKGAKALEGKKDASFGEKLKEGWKELWGKGKKADKTEGDKKPEGGEKPDKPDGDKKPEGSDKPDKPEGSEKPDKPEGSEKPDKPEGSDKPDKPEGGEKPKGGDKPDKPDKDAQAEAELKEQLKKQEERLTQLEKEAKLAEGKENELEAYNAQKEQEAVVSDLKNEQWLMEQRKNFEKEYVQVWEEGLAEIDAVVKELKPNLVDFTEEEQIRIAQNIIQSKEAGMPNLLKFEKIPEGTKVTMNLAEAMKEQGITTEAIMERLKNNDLPEEVTKSFAQKFESYVSEPISAIYDKSVRLDKFLNNLGEMCDKKFSDEALDQVGKAKMKEAIKENMDVVIEKCLIKDYPEFRKLSVEEQDKAIEMYIDSIFKRIDGEEKIVAS